MRYREIKVRVPWSVFQCMCDGCNNKVPFKNFTCHECFLFCNRDRKSDGHRLRVLSIRRRSEGRW